MNQFTRTSTRRRFLCAAGALTACGFPKASAVDSATATSLSGRIQKAVKWQMIQEDLSDEDKLKLVRDLGFDGVECYSSLRTGAPDITRLARASERVGVPVHGVINSSHPDIATAIGDAKLLGATSVLHVVRYDPSIAYKQNYADTQQILRNAIPEAEKQQISILIENVWASFLIEPLMTARYIDELDSPWVQLYFDIGNVVRWGWPEHWLQVMGNRVKKLDVKEYDPKRAMREGMSKGFDVPIGKGSIDWQRVRHELLQVDYNGWATAEVRGGDRQRLEEISQQMDDVLQLK
ncbi:MAG: sugar phosphate isomerase/epimerase family protein [Pirellulaceae bacterium]